MTRIQKLRGLTVLVLGIHQETLLRLKGMMREDNALFLYQPWKLLKQWMSALMTMIREARKLPVERLRVLKEGEEAPVIHRRKMNLAISCLLWQ